MIPHRQNHSNVQLDNRRHREEIDAQIRDRKTLLVDKMSSMSDGVKLVLCTHKPLPLVKLCNHVIKRIVK